MNKEDILDLILNGKPLQRGIPCGFWMHFPSSNQVGEASVEIHKEYYDATQVQLMKMMNEHLYHTDVEIHSSQDWRKITSVPLDKTGYVEYLEEIRQFRRAKGENAFILATIHGVLVSACHATDGVGKFPDLENTVTRHLKKDPESVCVGLSAIADTLLELSIESIKAGADGIYYAALGAEESRFSEAFYTKYIKPIEIKLLSEVKKEGIVFLHICKDYPRIPMFADYPCHVVNWTEHVCNTTLEEALDLFPKKSIMCGFDNRPGSLLFDGDIDELTSHIISLSEKVGRDRLLIGADCTLPANTDLNRLREISMFCETY